MLKALFSGAFYRIVFKDIYLTSGLKKFSARNLYIHSVVIEAMAVSKR